MKKIFSALIIFTAVLCAAFPAFAEIIDDTSTGQYCGENLRWKYDTETKTLTISGTGAIKDYDYQLTSMQAPWVKHSKTQDLEKVEISEGVTGIGEYAFYYCSSLKSVTLPDSLKTIGNGAFYNCDALTDITFPSGLTSIGDEAFEYCKTLTDVTIPGSVADIGESAFSGCDNLAKVTIQDGVKTIGYAAFYLCQNLMTAALPDSITSIGDKAFYSTAFYEDWLYGDDTASDMLYLGKHLIKARSNTSGTCSVAPGTKTIAAHAFESCDDISCIAIPKSVTNIGDEAFFSCFDLRDINVDADNAYYCSDNGILYNKEKTEIIRLPKEKAGTSFTIPNGVTKIVDGAFEYCQSLIRIIIPNGVSEIGNDAFSQCNKLTSIKIPSSVTSIGSGAFYYCSQLTDMSIPDGVTEIGENTFYYCSKLKSITIPNSLMIIDRDAFYGCKKIDTVNYIGSEDDWNDVTGSGKYVLNNAGINYCSGVIAKYSDDNKEIFVKPIKTAIGKTVSLALYNGDRFVEMQSALYNGEEITFTPSKAHTRAKVMIWESLDGMIPVCGSAAVK